MKVQVVIMPLWFAAISCAAPAATMRPESQHTLTGDQLLAIAEVAERGGDHLRAQQYLQTALNIGVDPERVLPQLLHLYIADGQYRLAIDMLQHQLRTHPQQSRLRLLLADLYAATQLTAAAVDEYERVLTAAPDSARAHYALATLLHDAGYERARADQHFRAYLASAPTGPHADEARSLLLEAMP